MTHRIPRLLLAAAAALSLTAAYAADQPKLVPDSVSDFEDGTLQGWRARGTETIALDATAHHGGAAALRASGRTATWNGPIRALSANVVKGATYRVSAWAMSPDGPDTPTITASLELGWPDPAMGHQYKNITAFKLKKGDWTQLQYDVTVTSDN